MAELEERVGKLENRVTAIETAQPYLKDLLDRTTKSQETMVRAVSAIEVTLSKLDNKIDTQGEKIDRQGEDIKKLTTKVDLVEDKGKIDFVGWLKSNWYWIAIVVGMGIYQVSNYVKF